MKAEEIKLAFQKVNESKIELTQLSDSAISSLRSFLDSQVQKTYDQKELVLKQIDSYNKMVDTTNSKFTTIEKTEYLKAYNDITSKAKELDIAPAQVKGLVELDKTYSGVKKFVNELTKL